MLEMCDLLVAHASDREVLRRDPVVQAAAQRWLEVLGEAATHVSVEVKESASDVPWKELMGIRVILAHAYHHVDGDIVGSVVADHIPRVAHVVRAILADHDLDE